MTDIFQEVDEDLRREEYAKLWKRHGTLIIGVCVAIILVATGIVLWRNYQNQVRETASLKYQEIVRAGEPDAQPISMEKAKAIEAASDDLTEGYRRLASLERAGALVRAKSYPEAIKIFQSIAADTQAPRELRDLSTLRWAYLEAESLSLADMRARVGTLAAPNNAFRFSANELLAYVAYRTADYKAARDYTQAILADPLAPPNLRRRSEDMAGLIARQLPETEAPAAAKPAAPAAAPARSAPAAQPPSASK